jgi:hypothetical protein
MDGGGDIPAARASWARRMAPDQITAYATVALVLATIGLAVPTIVLAVAAWRQLPFLVAQLAALNNQLNAARLAEEATERRTKEWETVRVCAAYDSDPVLDSITRRIWETSEGGKNYKNEAVSQRDLISFLNYLDGIATGITQNLYIENIVRDHLRLIFKKAVEEILVHKIIDSVGYEAVIEVYARWYPTQAIVTYQSTGITPKM